MWATTKAEGSKVSLHSAIHYIFEASNSHPKPTTNNGKCTQIFIRRARLALCGSGMNYVQWLNDHMPPNLSLNLPPLSASLASALHCVLCRWPELQHRGSHDELTQHWWWPSSTARVNAMWQPHSNTAHGSVPLVFTRKVAVKELKWKCAGLSL